MVSLKASLLIFSKAPIAGYAKRRLIPALGEEGAAQLQQQMTKRMVEEAVASGIGAVTLCCAPHGQHPFFQQLMQQYPVDLQDQQGDGLGERMSNAIRHALEQSDAAILCGSDSVELGQQQLAQVKQALQHAEVVLIPALDGGYLLIAMRRWLPQIFEQIEWGSDRVLAQTVERLGHEEVSWKVLAPLSDIDTPEDLGRLPSEWLAGV